ncbi:MAG: M20/M25/M40 family metallo-hydrolase [Spirochaetaceae bacterium]|nr:MAG: M20/M25/M40 family metallo-hydrolase [Spirochaetaceae bacterium]
MRFSTRSKVSVGTIIAISIVAAILAITFATAPIPERPFGTLPETSADVTRDDLEAHVRFLAHPELRGRETGSPEIAIAERYIADAFERFGLAPKTELGSFFHAVTMYRRDFDPDNTYVELEIDGQSIRGVLGRDFRPFFFSDTGTVRAQPVFVGYGIVADEYDWDDFEQTDVEGKIVVMLRYEPGAQDPSRGFAGTELSAHSHFLTKAQTAVERGATGMMLFTGPLDADAPEDLRSIGIWAPDAENARSPADTRFRIPDFPAIHVSQSFAERLFAFDSIDGLVDLQSRVDARDDTPAPSVQLAEISIVAEHGPTPVPGRNVLGVLPGRDPDLSSEYVVIGAHHDHLGAFTDDPAGIYHGADDNASGVAAVLELAEYFATTGPRDRTLVFVTFTGEEYGLLGSQIFVRDQIVQTEKIALMINLDMLGRNPDQPVRVYTGRIPPERRERLEGFAEKHRVEVTFRTGRLDAVSDHFPFHSAGVPVVSFFTGLHDDYHTPHDTAERLDYDRMERIVRVVADLADEFANSRDTPTEF